MSWRCSFTLVREKFRQYQCIQGEEYEGETKTLQVWKTISPKGCPTENMMNTETTNERHERV